MHHTVNGNISPTTADEARLTQDQFATCPVAPDAPRTRVTANEARYYLMKAYYRIPYKERDAKRLGAAWSIFHVEDQLSYSRKRRHRILIWVAERLSAIEWIGIRLLDAHDRSLRYEW